MKLDLKKLYKPYGRHVSLDDMLEWFRAKASSMGIPEEVVQATIILVFTEMANGRKFNKYREDFTVDNADLNLYMLEKLHELHNAAVQAYADTIQTRVTEVLVDHISADNKKYTEENMAYKPWKEALQSRYYKFMDTKRSPTLKLYKKVKNGLSRSTE